MNKLNLLLSIPYIWVRKETLPRTREGARAASLLQISFVFAKVVKYQMASMQLKFLKNQNLIVSKQAINIFSKSMKETA